MIEKPPIIQSLVRRESRARARARSLLAGIACYRDYSVSFDCTIRDLSDAGARLRLPFLVTLPSHFYLISVKAGTAYDARIAWITGRDIGVSWSEQISLAEPDSRFAHLRRLWLAKC